MVSPSLRQATPEGGLDDRVSLQGGIVLLRLFLAQR
jgi:hypothetical protein